MRSTKGADFTLFAPGTQSPASTLEETRSQSTRAASRGRAMGPGAEETNDSDADEANASISYPPLPILIIIPFRHDLLDLHLLLR